MYIYIYYMVILGIWFYDIKKQMDADFIFELQLGKVIDEYPISDKTDGGWRGWP